MDWKADNFKAIDTPALIIDKEKVKQNIQTAITLAGSAQRLRPHVKTHKMLEVAQLQMAAGIAKFKCATIAEAEMLGMAGAADVLLAYQPQGPKIDRVLALQQKFPKTAYAVLIDHIDVANQANAIFKAANEVLAIYFDLNVGHNRTGIKPEYADKLFSDIKSLSHLKLIGLHIYDGHIRMPSLDERRKASSAAFEPVWELKDRIEEKLGYTLNIIAGGSPSFTPHAMDRKVECSPGTWIFWDARYGADYEEQPFEKAAVVATRVISRIDDYTFCLDLGHKSIASEMPFPRAQFIDIEGLTQIGHSEEHLVVRADEPNKLVVGQLLLAYPYHICPTVALYDHVQICENGGIVDNWQVIARDRKITI
jgi:D-serine deaminase-like pyridoxal phosphate-dependent protein